jgi:anaerobic glycerol-3-phosphate dehydrogenase
LPQEFDVVCLGGGVAGEAIAVGLQGSGLTLAAVERELVGGVFGAGDVTGLGGFTHLAHYHGEVIKMGIPLKTLADVIHPFPAFNRVLGGSLDELAAKAALQSAARS